MIDWNKVIADMAEAAMQPVDSATITKHKWVYSAHEDSDGGVLDVEVCEYCGIDSVLSNSNYCGGE